MILIVLGLAVRVSTLPTFLRKMYGGKGGKAKTPWAFSFQAKRMTQDRKAKGQRSGASIPNHGISSSNAWAYCISSPNAWAHCISNQNALAFLIYLDMGGGDPPGPLRTYVRNLLGL